jgi:7-cyano-7-deazaguanine synthase in queuosine biosynthesis
MKTTTFINLSGGVDSTYYLWRWLKEHPEEVIRVHHCRFNVRRKQVEDQASDAIVNWLRDNGYQANIDYIKTTMTKGTISNTINDIEMIGAIAGFAARLDTIKTVLLPYCKEETRIIRRHFAKGKHIKQLEDKHRTAVFIKMMELGSKRTFDFTCDYLMKTKQDMVNELPDELLSLTWYCRKPAKNSKPCESCFNCKRVIRALKNREKA